ncbi:unnamed protein product [Effrenium voratum]|uniref:Uncharacterized protein n=1 Tax=Effrenium voratum TaxID=2562239 RepID=A0AA36N0Z6_9DINO|nr:unnamed protein product [Effrenium voratum]
MGSADKGKVLIMNPEEYAAAAGELLVISIIISWILTYFFNYGIIADNQLKRRLGYNNLCVGWDEPPAQLVAAPIFVGIIWLQMRYMQLDFYRAALDTSSSAFQDRMVLVANFANCISLIVCILIFVIPPKEKPLSHSLAFVQLVVFGYIAFAANFLECHPKHHPQGSWVFLAVFGMFSIMFGACVVFQLVVYEQETETPGPIPWYITATGDYGWFACLACQGYFRPRAPSVSLDMKLVSDDDYKVEPEISRYDT